METTTTYRVALIVVCILANIGVFYALFRNQNGSIIDGRAEAIENKIRKEFQSLNGLFQGGFLLTIDFF